MANLHDRSPENVLGRFYVDSSCTDCDLCRQIAPEIFSRQNEIGLSIVHRQPTTQAEIELAEEALGSCPSESIGNDGTAPGEIRSFAGESERRD